MRGEAMIKKPRQLRLCEFKDAVIDVCLKLANEAEGRFPVRARYELDTMRCPNSSGHCPKSGQCAAMKDSTILHKISQIEDELFKFGFVKITE